MSGAKNCPKRQSKDKEDFSCEWKPQYASATSQVSNKSIIYKFYNNYTWEGVKTEAYKQQTGDFANMARNTIIGAKGESCLFDVRYFEISAGGFSSFEKHQHEHVVICMRGKGKVSIEDTIYDLNFLDIVYISPDTPHQFINEGKEPFGFFCIVNRQRDKPQELARAF